MPQVILDIPQENIPLLLEVAEAMGIDIHNITVKDKSPDWHQQILNERLENYKAGKTKVTSWDEFERELNCEDDATNL